MERHPLIRNGLVAGVILLCLDVGLIPIINFQVVKASDNSEFVELTIQACSIQGFVDTTVKLEKQQYENLMQYMVEYRARVNQTTTTEEVIPLFKDAVVKLNSYGLLPKGMSIVQAQKLVTGGYLYQKNMKFMQNRFTQNQDDVMNNVLCYVTGQLDNTFVVHRIVAILTWIDWILIVYFFNHVSILALLIGIFALYMDLTLMIRFKTDVSPFGLFEIFGVGGFDPTDDDFWDSSGWLKSYGLLGVYSWNGTFRGNLPGLPIMYDPVACWVYQAMWGFSGIKIVTDEDGDAKLFFGTAIVLGVDTLP